MLFYEKKTKSLFGSYPLGSSRRMVIITLAIAQCFVDRQGGISRLAFVVGICPGDHFDEECWVLHQ